jgi:tetratricopeptide (TPR) repeat protein
LTSELQAQRPLVGRQQVLRDLHAALEQAVAGDGCLFLVAGEPGIGKTRLAQHLSADVARTGVMALWGTCWDGEGAPAFWPWLQVLRGYGAARDRADLRAELGSEAGEIARLVPELASGGEVEPAVDASAEARFRLFDSVAAFLRRASEGQPLLVVLDDLHWADEPSLQLLRFLAGDLRGSRLLLLGTYRDLEVGPDHPLARLAGQLTGAVHQLQLEGLSPPEVGELVTLLTGSPLSDDRATAVHRLTNGNPFFVRELVRLPATAPTADSRMPQGVRQVVRRRLTALSPPCRDLLAAAAVIGPDFDWSLLSAMLRMPLRRAAALLSEAKAARVVEEAPGEGRYRFVHALVREVLYSDLPDAQRRQLHHQAGATLEQRHGGHLEGREAELAAHFRQAGGGPDLARALELSEAAADRSLRLLAHEDAATHLERALDLLELVDDADDHRRCRLLLSLARARMAAGEIAAARKASSRAAAVAREIGALDLLAQAALGFQAEFTAESVDDVEVHLLEEALQGLDGRRPELRARLLARLARALLFGPQMERRRALADEAEALARRLGDPATLSAVLYEWHQAVWGLPSDEPRGRLRIAQEAIALAEGIGDHTSALHCRALLLGDLLELGEMERLRTEMADYAAAVERLRQRQLAWQPLMQRATLAMLEARFDEADALAGEGLALGRRVQHAGIDNFYSAIWSINRMLQGRHGETLEAMRRAVRAFPAFPVYRAPLALALIESGRREEARAEFERLAAGDFLDLPRDFVWVMFLAMLSMVCVRLGDRRRALLLYDLLLPSEETNVRVTRIGIACAGSAHHYLGLLCATLGRWDEAVRRFEAAVALHRRMASPVLMVTSQHELGRALLARAGAGDAERGRAELAAAHQLAAALGVLLGPDEPAPPEATRVELRREGDTWAVERAGRAFRLRDSVGLRHLAQLLTEPGRERHALDLAGPGGAAPHETASGGRLLDDRARAEYRDRLRELAGEIEQAESWGDPERAASARREVDLLTEQLAAAVGLGGRDRGAASSAERARVTVTKAIRAAQQRIAQEDAELGAHLEVSVRTGSFCVYRPDPGSPITWAVRA